MTQPQRLRLSIRGQVQGVGYRAFLRDEARRLGLAGWVRNRRDGTVEALVAGPKEALDDLSAQARRGPPGGVVEAVDVVADNGAEPLAGFEILPTF